MLSFSLKNKFFTHGRVPCRELTPEERKKVGIGDTKRGYVVIEGDLDVSVLKVGDELFEFREGPLGTQVLFGMGEITEVEKIPDLSDVD